MFNWIEKDNKLECHYQADRGDVILGTVELDDNLYVCKVNTGLIDDIIVVEKVLTVLAHAKKFVESVGHMQFCEQCNEMHYENSFCECGACLYENGKTLNDPDYPFFECTVCKRVNFWD